MKRKAGPKPWVLTLARPQNGSGGSLLWVPTPLSFPAEGSPHFPAQGFKPGYSAHSMLSACIPPFLAQVCLFAHTIASVHNKHPPPSSGQLPNVLQCQLLLRSSPYPHPRLCKFLTQVSSAALKQHCIIITPYTPVPSARPWKPSEQGLVSDSLFSHQDPVKTRPNQTFNFWW